MTEQEWLLICLMEECSEVSHRISKALRFGLEEVQPNQSFDNSQRIALELDDLMAVVDMLQCMSVIELPNADNQAAKKAKVKKYMEYAKSLGNIID